MTNDDGWFWGNRRGGGGAPLRDSSGAVVTNLRLAVRGAVEIDHSVQSSSQLNPRFESNSSPNNSATTPKKFMSALRDMTSNSADRDDRFRKEQEYKAALQEQIEENKRRKEMELQLGDDYLPHRRQSKNGGIRNNQDTFDVNSRNTPYKEMNNFHVNSSPSTNSYYSSKPQQSSNTIDSNSNNKITYSIPGLSTSSNDYPKSTQSGYVRVEEYDQLTSLCEQLRLQQELLQREVREQSKLIEGFTSQNNNLSKRSLLPSKSSTNPAKLKSIDNHISRKNGFHSSQNDQNLSSGIGKKVDNIPYRNGRQTVETNYKPTPTTPKSTKMYERFASKGLEQALKRTNVSTKKSSKSSVQNTSRVSNTNHIQPNLSNNRIQVRNGYEKRPGSSDRSYLQQESVHSGRGFQALMNRSERNHNMKPIMSTYDETDNRCNDRTKQDSELTSESRYIRVNSNNETSYRR